MTGPAAMPTGIDSHETPLSNAASDAPADATQHLGTASGRCGPDWSGSACGGAPGPTVLAPEDRLAALRAALARETEPLVTLTHLQHLCRNEHRTLWEQADAPRARARAGGILAGLAAELPPPGAASSLDQAVRRAFAAALDPADGLEPVVIAHGLAQLVDERFGHSFADSLRARSPYQPGVGDPVSLGNPDLRAVLDMPPTSPPRSLANRLDETRRIRLAGEWATQFRLVFDYTRFDTLAGLIGPDTVLATCHPNRALAEFVLPADRSRPSFGVRPTDPIEQAARLDQLIGCAGAGTDVFVLPELSVAEPLALNLERWLRRTDGPRLLVAGSFHHLDDHAADDTEGPLTGMRRRNTAIVWVRGRDRPLMRDRHSPADRPVAEDIQSEGWPHLQVHAPPTAGIW